LHFQVHPCGVQELFVDPLPEGASRDGALYPDGAHITDLKEVRDIFYKMQRPAIDPKVRSITSSRTEHSLVSLLVLYLMQLVYPHDWSEKDLVLFHNRGVLHTVVGTFSQDRVRAFHQCNLAASSDPLGPTPEHVKRFA
jgi:alpha-ketoglutarate-dependent taurine dioxygenase